MGIWSFILVLTVIYSQAAASPLSAAGPSSNSAAGPSQTAAEPTGLGELIFAELLWRHGDRTPAGFINGDPYSDPSNWPVGLGELTNTGKRMHFFVGKWLRAHFDGFLPETYSENDTYCRSTDVDRTLASAYSNLAGLYPPKGDQVWNENLNWQPIPVHTVDGNTDYIIGGSIIGCPRFDQLVSNLMASDEMKQFIQKHQKLINYIAGHTNTDWNDTLTALGLATEFHDNLYIETLYGKPLDDWTKVIYPSAALDDLALKYYVIYAYTTELAKIRVGYFLKEVLDHASDKADGTMSPDRKLWIYSAHDINISTVLYGMGLFDNQFVQYAAMLMFKFYKNAEGVVHVTLSYRKHWDDETATILSLPTCGLKCTLDEVYQIYADILPTQSFDDACAL